MTANPIGGPGPVRTGWYPLLDKPYTKGRWKGLTPREVFPLLTKREDNGCLRWTGSAFENGYGRLNIRNVPGSMYAHRVSWAIANGREPSANMTVAHTCDNRWCVEPTHLVLMTQAENMADMVRKRRVPLHRRKIEEDEVAAVLKRRADGASILELSREFGLDIGHLSRLCRGLVKKWAHLCPNAQHVRYDNDALHLHQPA